MNRQYRLNVDRIVVRHAVEITDLFDGPPLTLAGTCSGTVGIFPVDVADSCDRSLRVVGGWIHQPAASATSGTNLDHREIAYRVGRSLRFDPKSETFSGDARTNRMLTRKYRSPWEFPQS